MADDPYVREIGRITDDVGRLVIVGVDYLQAEEFGQLYVSACWAAARDIERLAVQLAGAP
jgi:hypothetical protein